MKSEDSELYVSIVIVGRSQTQLAWHWSTWSKITPWLDPLIAATNEKTGVRSVQGVGEKHKDVRFGQLGWDMKSHQKWTHLSPINKDESLSWGYANTEIWAPRWTVCLREERNPVVFIAIENPHIVTSPKPGQFSQFIQISVKIVFYDKNHFAIDRAVQNIAELLESSVIIYRVSPWVLRGDSVQSVLNNHLHYLGMNEDLAPDLSKTTGNWQDYTVQVKF